MFGRFIRLGCMIALVFLIAPPPTAQSFLPVPPGFQDDLVTAISVPTALAWTPDGRMVITTQTGQVRMYQAGALLATPALSLGPRVCSDFERGLLGVAVHPNFATNGFIYLYYTFNKFPATPCQRNSATEPVNRVSRYVLGSNNIIDPASETVLIDNMPSPNGNHNAGDLAFGKDGFLYISVGDGGCDYNGDSGCAGSNNAARDQHVLQGKILRITDVGGIPASNPFQGAGTARCNLTGITTPGDKCQETFAWGLRNPFRFAFDPNAATTRFFINDVGQNVWEEIDEAVAGADYGWNVREGFCANGSTTNCGTPPAGMTNPIYAYGRSAGCASITGGAFVPNGIWPAQYNGTYIYGDYVCNRMFTLTRSGTTWTATDFATGLDGGGPVHMTFGPHNATQALYYTSYANGGQVRRISYLNSAPSITIQSPGPTARFAVGQQITLNATATDPEDGALPNSQLQWRVLLHHNTHTHPYLPPTPNPTTITGPAPEDLAATTTSYLELEITATDSLGSSTVITRELRPQLVDLTFGTTPAALRLQVNDLQLTGPQTLTSWQGYMLRITAPPQQSAPGVWQVFSSWSDGGAASHTITTPATPTTYTATFVEGKALMLPLVSR